MSNLDKREREQSLIQSILNAELNYQRRERGEGGPRPLVALSRDFGAGGDLIARRLGEKLGVEVYDKEILDGIARESKVDKHLMEELDEKVRKDKSAWIRGLFTTNTAFPAHYRHHLVNVVLGIAHTGGVIMGRGAHIILSDRLAFRVRVIGGVERCAERVAEREGIERAAALSKVESVNQERGEFLWKLFNQRQNDASLLDLIINTDRFDDVEAAADLIVVAMISMGFDVPEQVVGE